MPERRSLASAARECAGGGSGRLSEKVNEKGEHFWMKGSGCAAMGSRVAR